MDKPRLEENQFALIVVDSRTGHVYNTDLEIFVSDGKETYFVFDSIQAVKDFVKRLSEENNTYEYTIYNNNYELVEHIL